VEEIMAISANGVVIRVPVRGIKYSHRQAQGATLMKVQAGDTLVSLASLAQDGEDAGGDGVVAANGAAAAVEAMAGEDGETGVLADQEVALGAGEDAGDGEVERAALELLGAGQAMDVDGAATGD
jgi:hypothetical protein